MFVIFNESPSRTRGQHVHNGNTVTIHEQGCDGFWRVGRYDPIATDWVTWDAHISELENFGPEDVQ